MRIGVTGSRRTPPPAQLLTFGRVLVDLQGLGAWELRHGACVGADEQMSSRAAASGLWTVAHPPSNGALLSSRALDVSDEVEDPQPYLVRNRSIVDAVDVLVALPRTAEEERRSGTWSTVRYATSRGVPVVLVLPDGSVDDHRGVLAVGG